MVPKNAFLGHFDLKNSKTCTICFLIYIFMQPIYSALELPINKCHIKGLSEKLSPELAHEMLSENAGKSSGVQIRQTPTQTAVRTGAKPEICMLDRDRVPRDLPCQSSSHQRKVYYFSLINHLS